jgi:LysR family transcriptional regulator, regulator for bpeEF and oprC
MDMQTFASPEYLQQFGMPLHPHELAQHHVLGFVFPTGQLLKLKFGQNQESIEIEPKGSIRFNHSEAMTDAAIQGLGIIQVPYFHATVAVENKQLIPILENWSVPGHPIQIVYPQNRHLSSKVRAFVEFVEKIY